MQKSIIITLLLATLFLNSRAQSTEDVRVNVPVKSVILYLDGAEVAQTKNVTVNAGRTMLIFTGLSPKLISKVQACSRLHLSDHNLVPNRFLSQHILDQHPQAPCLYSKLI